jgi:hypothetical protein
LFIISIPSSERGVQSRSVLLFSVSEQHPGFLKPALSLSLSPFIYFFVSP